MRTVTKLSRLDSAPRWRWFCSEPLLLSGLGIIVVTIFFFEEVSGAGEWFSVIGGTTVALSISLLALRFGGLVVEVFRPTRVIRQARVANMILATVTIQMTADSVTAFARKA
ncbi:MAG: hypothetical protein JW384_02134 [Nitrosomonadaceae bacterium]|nr:hypothetical protein [Nitrosomonadaceae bacterium]